VTGVIDLDEIRQAIKAAAPRRQDRLVLVDRTGRVIAHPSRESELTARDLSADAVFAAAQGAPAGSVKYTSPGDGGTRWGTFTRLRIGSWVLWANRESEFGAARTASLARDVAASGVVALLLVVAGALVVSEALARPLRRLLRATHDVADGRFRESVLTISGSRITEFNELYESFTGMADALRLQYEDLEGRVATRTRSLQEQTREAQQTATLLRSQEEIRRGYGELAALLNSLDRSHILEVGSRKIASSLGAPIVAVYLTDGGTEGLRLKTYAALDAAVIDTALLAPSGLPSEVVRRAGTIVVARGAGDERLQLQTGVGAIDIAAVSGLPLRTQGGVSGVLVVATLAPLTDDVQSFLDNAASQLSVALSNAELFESVRYQSHQLEALNAELHRVSEVKSQFLAAMSHELRTPLNSIIGFTELLLAGGREPLAPRQRTALERVLTSGRHLLALINDVLDLSKIEAGRMEARPEAFSLKTVLHECLETIEPSVMAKGLALGAVGVDDAPGMVQDQGKVRQIVLNLLSNAVKFTAMGGVELRVDRDADDAVVVQVVDSGIGISLEHQALIFESFWQAGVVESPEHRGTGLGLPISRRLAELLGGTLTVQSGPTGSTFTLRLPSRWPPVSAESRAADASGPADVLVIDDDRDAADLVRHALAEASSTVEWASTAQQGLARARAAAPRVILLDVMLQGHDDGWDVLHALRSDSATAAIPVVVYSVIDNPERARALGAQGVLVKPAGPSEVRRALRPFLAAHEAAA
jgi:signal transduction histidine kinase/ActR/RegA family two-component response regulator/HAMP domain-containing protein